MMKSKSAEISLGERLLNEWTVPILHEAGVRAGAVSHGGTPTAAGAVVSASGVSGGQRIGVVTFSTWSRATAVASTATIHSPTASGCLMYPLLPCASVAAGGGPVSQLLRFALGLLCVVSASTSQCVESSPMLVM